MSKKNKQKNKLTWDDILEYEKIIYKLCINNEKMLRNSQTILKDNSKSFNDLAQDCMIHIYSHRDRYDSERGAKSTFIWWKTRQQIFKSNSKDKTRSKYLLEYNEKKYNELIKELENE